MHYKDYYAALGIPKNADLDQIKKAYRQLAHAYHPDVSKAPDAEARFKDAAQAYATLKDPVKRAAYDQLEPLAPNTEFTPPPQWQEDHSDTWHSFEYMDLDELMAAMGKGGKGAHGPHSPMPINGRDYENTVHISLEDARRGTALTIEVAATEGQRTLQVAIPPGVREGQRVRLRGQGGHGRHGGGNGDLYLRIALKTHPVFRPDRHDLYFDLFLSPWEAALGAEVQVPTLDGAVLLTVPSGTPAGRTLRLRGRGLAKDHSDLFALVHIANPPTLNSQERKLYQELASTSAFNPRSFPLETPHAPHTPHAH